MFYSRVQGFSLLCPSDTPPPNSSSVRSSVFLSWNKAPFFPVRARAECGNYSDCFVSASLVESKLAKKKKKPVRGGRVEKVWKIGVPAPRTPFKGGLPQLWEVPSGWPQLQRATSPETTPFLGQPVSGV